MKKNTKLSSNQLLEYMAHNSQQHNIIYCIKAIENNNPNRVNIIKNCVSLGYSLNIIILEVIKHNDLLCLATCLKYDINLNARYIKGNNLLHYCVISNNIHALKTFIKKGVPIDRANDLNDTPLLAALEIGNLDCALELIKNNACMDFILEDHHITNKSIPHKEELAKYDVLSLLLSNYIDKYDNDEPYENYFITSNGENILNITLSKTTSYNYTTIVFIRELVERELTFMFDKLIMHNPECLNDISVYPESLLSDIINSKQQIFIDKYLRLETTILDLKNDVPYVFMLSDNNDLKNIRYLVEQNPNIAKILTGHEINNTLIDYILLNTSKYNRIYTQELLDTVILLLDNGCELTITIPIQLSYTDIVEYILGRYRYKYENYDLLAQACKFSNENMIDMLIDNNAKFMVQKKMPTCLTSAIKQNNVDIVDYLMTKPMLTRMLKSETKKRLLNYCVNTGFCNFDIMRHFTTEEHLKTLRVDESQIILNRLISDIVSETTCKTCKSCNGIDENIVRYIYRFLSILKSCLLLDSKKTIHDVIDMYCYIVTKIQHKDKLIFSILSLLIEAEDFNKIKRIFIELDNVIIDNTFEEITVKANIKSRNNICSLYDTITNIRNNYLIKYFSDIYNLTTYIEKLVDINDNYIEHRYSICYDVYDSDYIEKLLSKMRYPIKHPHYDEMYNKLNGINCFMTNTPQYIEAIDNDTGITAKIYKIANLPSPMSWFDDYTYNIGKTDKCDHKHMFPFIMDN